MKKTFDCIEMKRHSAMRLASLLATMSHEEQLAFWQQRTIELRKLLQDTSPKHQDEERISHIHVLQQTYGHLLSSSDEFARRKQEDIE